MNNLIRKRIKISNAMNNFSNTTQSAEVINAGKTLIRSNLTRKYNFFLKKGKKYNMLN